MSVILLIPLALALAFIVAGAVKLVLWSIGPRPTREAGVVRVRRPGSGFLVAGFLAGLGIATLLVLVVAGLLVEGRSYSFSSSAEPQAAVAPAETASYSPTIAIPVDRGANDSSLPEWVDLAENRVGRVRTVVLVSRWATSAEAAERDVANVALARTLAYLREIEPGRESWDVSAELIERHAFGRRHVADRHESSRPHEFRVYRELKLTPELASIVPSSPASEPLPEWARGERESADGSNEADTIFLVSRQYATIEEAEEELLDQAKNRVRERFHEVHPPVKGWDVPEELVRKLYGPRRHVEEIERSSGDHTFRVHRVYRDLRLTPAITDTQGELYASWRQAVVARRLWGAGGGVAVATVALLLASIGLRRTRRRFDNAPGGRRESAPKSSP